MLQASTNFWIDNDTQHLKVSRIFFGIFSVRETILHPRKKYLVTKIPLCLLTILLVSLFLPPFVHAQIVINEVLNNPEGEEAGGEWVEIFNVSENPVPLVSCILFLDDSSQTQKIAFGEGDFVEKYKVITWDKSWLNNSGDQIRIECGSIVDVVNYGDVPESLVSSPTEGISFGRSPDGVGGFSVLAKTTLGETNAGPPTSTPVPTNTPTLTPKPERTPTLVQAPVSSKAATPTKFTTPTPIVAGVSIAVNSTSFPEGVSQNQDSGSGVGQVAVNSESISKLSPTPAVLSAKTANKLPFLAFIFIGLGICISAISLYPFVKGLWTGYNSNNDKID